MHKFYFLICIKTTTLLPPYWFVLLVAAELDRNALLPSIISAYNMIPNCQLSIVPNAGQVVFLENWEAFVPFLNG